MRRIVLGAACWTLVASTPACDDDAGVAETGTESDSGVNARDRDGTSDDANSGMGPAAQAPDGASTTGLDAGESATDEPDPTVPMLGDAGNGETLCAKYGGAAVVQSVVENQVLGAIAGDCRVNTFFTSLNEDAFTRVSECLVIQVQELFACEGVVYAGSEASNGLPCRDMRQAHLGLGISSGDFDALIEDVVAGLSEAGVEEADIAAAAPALLGMESDIVELDEDPPSQSQCLLGALDGGAAEDSVDGGMADGGGATDDGTLCAKYGGADSVAGVVRDDVIGAIASDCRINSFFTMLSDDAFTRVADCLTVQVQELFACEGVQYAGATASNGLPCRSMQEAHLGLNISQGDFDALIEDVVAGLSAAGIDESDIAVAAPALLGMQTDIVENEGAAATQSSCTLADAGVTP